MEQELQLNEKKENVDGSLRKIKGNNHKEDCKCKLCIGEAGFQKGHKVGVGREPWNKNLHGVKTNNKGWKPKNKRLDLREKSNEIIYMYQNKFMSTKEIGKEFGCCYNVIEGILRENNILMDSHDRVKLLRKEGKIKEPSNKRFDVRERLGEITHLYQDELMNAKDISIVMDCSSCLIENILRENNILITDSERRKILSANKKLKIWNKDYSKEKIINCKNCGKEVNTYTYNTKKFCSRECFLEDRKKNWTLPEEARKKLSAFGQGIPLEKWEGFVGNDPYPITFNEKFKLAIKQRDGFQCLKCGMFEEDHIKLFGIKEAIHHIDGFAKNTFQENCCVLCRRCNNEVKKDKEIWKVHFQSLLSKLYGYKYSEDGKPIISVEVKI